MTMALKSIALHLPECCAVAAPPAQKKSAEIGYTWPDERGQFRVRARGLRERLRERPDKVPNRDIYGAIFSGCRRYPGSIKHHA